MLADDYLGTRFMLTDQQLRDYHQQGYIIAPALFGADEVARYNDHYEAMRLRDVIAPNPELQDLAQQPDVDPLRIYPRIMQPHRHDETSLRWLIDSRINHCLTAILGQEPFAVQTMAYFKPAGARGQALHQDQYYLRVQPGTCIAAWMALDDIDEDNGCLYVVPGSHNWPLLCTVDADSSQSFSEVTVELPEGEEAVPVRMQPGDVLFFNGQLVHGSYPNSSKDRFRRSLIGHYIVGEAREVYRYYHPVLRMDGTEVTLGESERGGTCGRWVAQDGLPVLEMEAEEA